MTPLTLVRPLAVAAFALVVIAARAQAPNLLQRAQDVLQKLSFSGTRITMVKGKPLTERVFFSRGRRRIERENSVVIETLRERFLYERNTNTLRRMELIRRGGNGGGQGSRPKPLVGGNPKPPKPKGDFAEIVGDSVAGRPTRLIVTKTMGGEARYWIDQDTGMMLKAQAPAPTGRDPLDFEFTQITYGEQPDGLFVPNFPGAKFVDPRTDLVKVSREVGLPIFTLSDEGDLKLVRVENRNIDGRKVLHQTFRYGSKIVSLFVTTGSVSVDTLSKFVKNGSVETWQSGEYTLVLLGNVSSQELLALKGKVRS
jgi:hypothetical protein